MRPPSWLLLLVIILCVVLALGVAASGAAPLRRAVVAGVSGWLGGGPPGQRRRSPHLVVDTLNVAHWLSGQSRLSPETIVSAIDRTAPELKRRYSGRVIYVLKDRESQFNDAQVRELYRAAAERNQVYVAVAERYEDPPSADGPGTGDHGHSARGRDDFYMGVLASRLKCAVLTNDRFRDFDSLRANVPPFHATTYSYWGAPVREYLRPGRLRVERPPAVRPATALASVLVAEAHEGAPSLVVKKEAGGLLRA